ncbi:MAG TPA: DUF2339 domain-containing protein, partial [Rudaea sp.]
MTFVFMLLGALLGAWFCADVFEESTGWTGALFGLLFGVLVGQIRTLRARLARLEQAMNALPTTVVAAVAPVRNETAAPIAEATPEPQTPRSVTDNVPSMPASMPKPQVRIVPPRPRAAAEVVRPERSSPLPPAPQPAIARHAEPAPDSPLVAWIKRWFTEGNVPVKVGVLVLLLGVAALLKYATDEGWFRMPVEFRLAGVALAALGALVFAWRKRQSHRAFALSLQGGAIGILILTVFAAFRFYQILPAGLAFALLIVIVAGVGLLAVLQDSPALAVLGIVGGFAAPILVSTSSGNHVALFSYYAVLNAAIFAIAWVRPWRLLNLIGFAFTFVIGTAWGVLSYRPELFASTEPFLLLFFAFYLFIPTLYALRQAQRSRSEATPEATPWKAPIDGSLVFGTPLIAFLLQVGMLQPERMPMAYSALAAAIVYALLGAVALRRLGLKLLGESHALLAIGFATVAVPLALSAQATACTWAIEGAALVWLGLRQQRRIPRWIGYALQGFAGVAFVWQFQSDHAATPFANGAFPGALLIALAGFTAARLVERARKDAPVSLVLFAWAVLWWGFAFGNEIDRTRYAAWHFDAWIVLIAVSGAIAAELYRRLDWSVCRYPAAAPFVFAVPLMAMTASAHHGGPLEQWGALAWPVWLASALFALAALRRDERFARGLHFVFLWTVALLLGGEFGYAADRHFGLSDTWAVLAALVPFAALFGLALARHPLTRWPLGIDAEPLRRALLASVGGLLGLAWLVGLLHEGRAEPLPYVPIFNPL